MARVYLYFMKHVYIFHVTHATSNAMPSFFCNYKLSWLENATASPQLTGLPGEDTILDGSCSYNPEVWIGVMKWLLDKCHRATITWTMAAPAAKPTHAGAQCLASRHT